MKIPKNMKSTLLLMAVLFAGFSADAQNNTRKTEGRQQVSPEVRAVKSAERMQKQLNLTDQQTASIRSINERSVKSMQPVRSEMKELHQKTKAIREERNNQYKQVLSADQYAKYQEMQEKRRQKAHDRGEKHNGARGNATNGNRGGGTEMRPRQ